LTRDLGRDDSKTEKDGGSYCKAAIHGREVKQGPRDK